VVFMKKLLLILFIFSLMYFSLAGCTPGIVPVTPETGTGIVNGDFEIGDFSGWEVSKSKGFPRVIKSLSCSYCNYIAYMGDGNGGLESDKKASIEQSVDIPAGAGNAYLKFKYYINGTDLDGEGYDWMKVFVNDKQIKYVWHDTNVWQEFEYDISQYIGTTVSVKVEAWTTDGIYPAHYFIDDITVTWE